MRYLLKDLKVSEYFRDNTTGLEWKVLCNDWWDDGKLRDFIAINNEGNKKHFGFLSEDSALKDIELIKCFGEEKEIDLLRKENKMLREALEKIAYTPTFDNLCHVEEYASLILEGRACNYKHSYLINKKN